MSIVRDVMTDQRAVNVYASRMLAEAVRPRPAWWPKPEIVYGPDPESEDRRAVRELLAAGVTNPDEFLMALEARGFVLRDPDEDYDY